MIAAHAIGATVLALLLGLTVPVAEEGLRRPYPWPPLAQGTMDCRPVDRTTLECKRGDGKRYTCVTESASTVVCKEIVP